MGSPNFFKLQLFRNSFCDAHLDQQLQFMRKSQRVGFTQQKQLLPLCCRLIGGFLAPGPRRCRAAGL